MTDSGARRAPALPIIVPPDDAYACTACGSCCRRPWTVGIGEVEKRRYEAIDWSKHAPRLRGRTLWTPLAADAWGLERDASGACVFLEDDNRCLIHRVLGYSEKPQSCQAFPHSFIETPRGVRTSLSWATLGRKFGEPPAADVVEHELAEAYLRDRAANATFTVRDEATLALVDLFRDFVRDRTSSRTTDERLVAIAETTRAITLGDLDGRVHDAVTAHLHAHRPRAQTMPWPLLRGPLALPLILPVVASSAVRTPKDAVALAVSTIRDIVRVGFVPPHLEKQGAPRVAIADLGRAHFDPSLEADARWAHFLADVLQDGLMVAPDDLAAWSTWVIGLYAHARWLAKYSAARAARPIVSPEDVRWAMAEAPASTGPHWGPAGRIVRALGRRVAILYLRPELLARHLAVEV